MWGKRQEQRRAKMAQKEEKINKAERGRACAWDREREREREGREQNPPGKPAEQKIEIERGGGEGGRKITRVQSSLVDRFKRRSTLIWSAVILFSFSLSLSLFAPSDVFDSGLAAVGIPVCLPAISPRATAAGCPRIPHNPCFFRCSARPLVPRGWSLGVGIHSTLSHVRFTLPRVNVTREREWERKGIINWVYSCRNDRLLKILLEKTCFYCFAKTSAAEWELIMVT